MRSGALRNCKLLLSFGDLTIRITASGTLAVLSQDTEISKLLFTNGCVKPIINIADCESPDTNGSHDTEGWGGWGVGGREREILFIVQFLCRVDIFTQMLVCWPL